MSGDHRILVIEDDHEVRLEVAALLRDAGYEVFEAANGRTALQLASSAHPELILLDLILPDVPGFTLLQQLRALPGGDELPIVAVSGFDQRADDAVAAGERFTSYLRKPFGEKQLLAAVDALLAHLPSVHRS